jgi:hypothetical protein
VQRKNTNKNLPTVEKAVLKATIGEQRRPREKYGRPAPDPIAPLIGLLASNHHDGPESRGIDFLHLLLYSCTPRPALGFSPGRIYSEIDILKEYLF